MPAIAPAFGSSPVRFAVLSPVLPPIWSGQAVVLNCLLRGLDPGRYCLLSTERYDRETFGQGGPHPSASDFLPGQYHHLPPAHHLSGDSRRVVRLWKNLSGMSRELLRRALQIERVLRQEKCEAIVACSADLINIPAAWLAARRVGIAILVYMLDDYTTQWVGRFSRVWARSAWGLMHRWVDSVLVINAAMEADYRRRFGIRPIVLHNPMDGPIAPSGRVVEWNPSQEVRIVYTGAIYDAHYDAFRNLLTVLRQQGENMPPCRLHVYTACDPAFLQSQGITGPVVFHPHLTHGQALTVQRSADLLFLPLAFHSPYPDIIRTAMPMKMGEYLASGRPVLVHAPANAFVSRYFREHGCGVVVDRNDPVRLAQGLSLILESHEKRTAIVNQALRRAAADFQLEDARRRFLSAVDTAVLRHRRAA